MSCGTCKVIVERPAGDLTFEPGPGPNQITLVWTDADGNETTQEVCVTCASDTFATVGPAPAPGTDTFGNTYTAGDPVITFTDGSTLAVFADMFGSVTIATAPGVDTAGQAYAPGDTVIVFPDGTTAKIPKCYAALDVTKELVDQTSTTAQFVVTITNTHPDVTALDVALADDLFAVAGTAVSDPLALLTGATTTLAPGASTTVVYDYTYQPGEPPVTNTATASASNAPSATDTAEVPEYCPVNWTGNVASTEGVLAWPDNANLPPSNGMALDEGLGHCAPLSYARNEWVLAFSEFEVLEATEVCFCIPYAAESNGTVFGVIPVGQPNSAVIANSSATADVTNPTYIGEVWDEVGAGGGFLGNPPAVGEATVCYTLLPGLYNFVVFGSTGNLDGAATQYSGRDCFGPVRIKNCE